MRHKIKKAESEDVGDYYYYATMEDNLNENREVK